MEIHGYYETALRASLHVSQQDHLYLDHIRPSSPASRWSQFKSFCSSDSTAIFNSFAPRLLYPVTLTDTDCTSQVLAKGH